MSDSSSLRAVRCAVACLLLLCSACLAQAQDAISPPRRAAEVVLDADGDGVAETISRRIGYDAVNPIRGVVQVHSSRSGLPLYRLVGAIPNDHYGLGVAVVSDLDGDAVADLVVGAPLIGRDRARSRFGRVIVYSGADGRRIRVLHGPDWHQFGAMVRNAGDRNRDGAGDFWVSSMRQVRADRAELWWSLYSGATGRVLSSQRKTFLRLSHTKNAFSASLAADLDNDGAVGAEDLALLLLRIGSIGPDALRADLNADGIVDGADLGILLSQYNQRSDEVAVAAFEEADPADCGDTLDPLCLGCVTCLEFPGPSGGGGGGGGDGGGGTGGGTGTGGGGGGPVCANSLASPDRLLTSETSILHLLQMDADGSADWSITSGADLLSQWASTANGQSVNFQAGATSGLVEGQVVYTRTTANGQCDITFSWSIEIDELFLDVYTDQPDSLIEIGDSATITAVGTPENGAFRWWVESETNVPGLPAQDVVDFVDPGDSSSYTFDVGRYPGTISVWVEYTVNGVTRQSVVDLLAFASTTTDSDGDGLSDASEIQYGSHPFDPDTDGDGLLDGFEVAAGLDPLDAFSADPDDLISDAEWDSDGDGLTNIDEQAIGSDPTDFDTDGDGIWDGAERDILGTDPTNADTDGDGLDDGQEVILGANPLAADTDGDGVKDGCEHAQGFSVVVADAHGDTDNDGLPDLAETCLGTDPNFFDSDGDGLSDGFEADSPSLDPTLEDTDGDGTPDGDDDHDGDGLTNIDEELRGGDPDTTDTDGDGTSDGQEADQGSFVNDPTDGGTPPAADEIVLVDLTLGDTSGSKSERWRMRVGDAAGMITVGGEVRTETFPFRRGRSYEITLEWLGSTLGAGADYDWQSDVVANSSETDPIVVIDPQDIITDGDIRGGGGQNRVAGKRALLDVPAFRVNGATGEELASLNIGHWGNDAGGGLTGFDAAHAIRNDATATFIDDDPDRFFVQLNNAAANVDPLVRDKLQVQIMSLLSADEDANTDDEGASIELLESAEDSGIFVSEALLATAPQHGATLQTDDNLAVYSTYGAQAVPDGALHDRTIRTSIDGAVRLQFDLEGRDLPRVIPVSARSPDERRPVRFRVHVHLEPYRDTGFVNSQGQLVGAGDGEFSWEDSMQNGMHDPGERSEEYLDVSQMRFTEFNYQGGEGAINANGDGYGWVVSPDHIAKNIEYANAYWAQAGIKFIQEGPVNVTEAPLNSQGLSILEDGKIQVSRNNDSPEHEAYNIFPEINGIIPEVAEIVFTGALEWINGTGGPRAMAFSPRFFIGVNRSDEPYWRTCFAIMGAPAILNGLEEPILAHEFGHLLTGLPDTAAPGYILFPNDNPGIGNASVSGLRRLRHHTESWAQTYVFPNTLGSAFGNSLIPAPQ